MDWDDPRLVLAVAQEGSLSGAARRLRVTHSTVFRRLGAIEESLGVRLFERFRDGYSATPAGETVAALAARFADDFLALERKLSGQDLRPSGTVRIATSDTISTMLMRHVPEPHCADMLSAMETQISARCGHARKVAISLCTVTRPTAAHLAPFILLSSGRCLVPRQSHEILRQVAIRQNRGSASQEQIACRFRAVDTQALW
jgi:DNA-binding transcriptional LysR family regulator